MDVFVSCNNVIFAILALVELVHGDGNTIRVFTKIRKVTMLLAIHIVFTPVSDFNDSVSNLDGCTGNETVGVGGRKERVREDVPSQISLLNTWIIPYL